MGTLIEEAGQSLFWIEPLDDLVAESVDVKNFIEMTDLFKLKTEANEIVTIFVASNMTVKKRLDQQNNKT